MRFLLPLAFLFGTTAYEECQRSIDLLLVQDATSGFSDDIATISNQFPELWAWIEQEYPGSRCGIVSFRDKPITNFGYPEDYSYDLVTPLTDDVVQCTGSLAKVSSDRGGDIPEGSYEAMAIAAYDAEVGWRARVEPEIDNTGRVGRRVMIVVTDAAPHFELDYKKDNQGEAYTHPWTSLGSTPETIKTYAGSWEDWQLVYDYPSAELMLNIKKDADLDIVLLLTRPTENTSAYIAWQWVVRDYFEEAGELIDGLEPASGNFTASVKRALSSIQVDEFCYPVPSTAGPTTEAPSTEAPSTEAPSTEAPSTEAPSTEAPSTEAPSTEAPTTEAPTTEAPTTEAPTTEAPTTEAPTTEAPTTEAPTTEAPTTEAPTTEAPTTEAPTTEAPTTEAPTTEAPTTEAPTTEAPTTEAPTTEAPTTEAPTTEAATTEVPCLGCCKLAGETAIQSLAEAKVGESQVIVFENFSADTKKFVIDVEGVCPKKSCCLDGCCEYEGAEMIAEVPTSEVSYTVKFSDIASGVRRFRVRA